MAAFFVRLNLSSHTMKTPITLLALMLLCATSFAQETKTTSNSNGEYTEKFSVLKSDKKIKHGAYKLTRDYTGELVADGFYNNNKRDSVWHVYNGKQIVAQGLFKNDNLSGEWTYYSSKGAIINKCNYDTRELTYHNTTKADTATKFPVITRTDTVKIKLERPPIYLPGIEMLYRNIARSVRYPAAARTGRVTGKVVIGFTVGENGKTRDFKILQGIGAGCDEEALRVVHEVSADWIAGIFNGKPVAVQYRIPITFNLQ